MTYEVQSMQEESEDRSSVQHLFDVVKLNPGIVHGVKVMQVGYMDCNYFCPILISNDISK